jgi:hypothetical protein
MRMVVQNELAGKRNPKCSVGEGGEEAGYQILSWPGIAVQQEGGDPRNVKQKNSRPKGILREW